MADEQTDLKAQLEEKGQLVAALTERLEQAAEQLDRMQRSGGGRGKHGGGLPPEFVQDQKVLNEELHRFVEQWDAMQPGMTLGRIEMQITELRDLITEGSGGGIAIRATQSIEAVAFQGQLPEQTAAAISSAMETETSLSGYEAMKAGLLEADQDAPLPDLEGIQTETPSDDQANFPEPVDEIALVEAPEPVDFESAETDGLQAAIESRDEYISYLIRKLRNAESKQRPVVNWEALNDAPEELRNKLEAIENSLNETLRMAEVENSLERARLGREEMRLAQVDQQIQKELRRLSISDENESEHQDENDSPEEAQTESSSRWQRLFGKSSNEDE